jgi:23S rRNA (pseudouridine1915-N3)-methyltransferase
MQITLAAIGKLKEASLKILYEEYRKRLQWRVTLQEIEGKSAALENKHLLEAIPPSSYIIALDEKGENLKSEEFAQLLNEIQLHQQGKVTFVIGGADGLSQEIKLRANKTLSFGRMTWPHQLARILLMEQLYRAQQILSGHPYHRG